MKKIASVAVSGFIALTASAHAEIPPTPTADGGLTSASREAQAIVQRIRGKVTDWSAFCKNGPGDFKSQAKSNAMELKSIRAIPGFLPDDVATTVKYFATACHETQPPQ